MHIDRAFLPGEVEASLRTYMIEMGTMCHLALADRGCPHDKVHGRRQIAQTAKTDALSAAPVPIWS